MFPDDPSSPATPAPWADPSALDDAPTPSWIAPSPVPEDSVSPAPDSIPSAPGSLPGGATADGDADEIVADEPSPAEVVRDYEAEIATLQSQLATTISDIATIRRSLLEASERELVRLGLAIANKIVGRELTVDPSLVAEWARQGLKTLADQDQLQIMISPDIAEAVPDDAWRTATGEAVTPKVDPELPPGSCSVVGELSRVDASLAGRIGALNDALGPGEEEEEE
jgi:hypothetical protein